MITADAEDVRACYRLFLGREPDPAGARTFYSLISNGQFSVQDLADLFWSSAEATQLRAKRNDSSNQLELVELDGFRMTVAPRWNNINFGIARDKVYEPHITRHLVALLRRGSVFVDIGANVGYYSLLAAASGAVVHAFEPNSRNLWLLQKNARDNGFMIKIWPYALADSERLLIYNPLHGNGQVAELSGELPTEEQEILRSVTLDRCLEGVRPDIIKIDVEGAEGLVLAGAQRVLDQRPMVISEFSAASLPSVSGISGKEYLAQFVRRGYVFKLFWRDGHLEELSAEALLDASLGSEHNFVDFIAMPSS